MKKVGLLYTISLAMAMDPGKQSRLQLLSQLDTEHGDHKGVEKNENGVNYVHIDDIGGRGGSKRYP